MDGPSRRPTDSSLREGTPSLSEVPSGGARALWLLWGFSKVTRRKGGPQSGHHPTNGYAPSPPSPPITPPQKKCKNPEPPKINHRPVCAIQSTKQVLGWLWSDHKGARHMPVAFRLPLQAFFEREARHPRKPFLVQPTGAGEVQTLTWGEVAHQARCAAHWLRARELPQGSHIADR